MAKVVGEAPSVVVSADQIAILAIEFIKVLDLAQSAYLLHLLHKDDIDTWVIVRDMVLAMSTDTKIFGAAIDVLGASSKDALDESAYLIPGVLTVRQRTLVL